MKHVVRLFRNTSGSALVEMALVTPLLLIIMFGSVEVGNYFMDEHALVKAVRDSARFAARQNFSNYTGCSGSPGGTVAADAETIARKGLLDSTADDLLPNWGAATFSVTVSCTGSADGEDMLGIYRSRFGGTCNGSTANGCAQIVTVDASVPYSSIIGSFGFTGLGLSLNASSQAAVTGQ